MSDDPNRDAADVVDKATDPAGFLLILDAGLAPALDTNDATFPPAVKLETEEAQP
jgi:hypothetical protein